MDTQISPLPSLNAWRQLLADPEKQWKAGYSAMATAQSWHAAHGLPPEIAAILGPDAHLIEALPEHKVPLPGGRRESQCDVFARVRIGTHTCALAVEGKVNEAFGPTLGDWLKDASNGKQLRLAKITAMLGLTAPLAPDLRYQLFHRTAAAVVEAERLNTDSVAMIVQSFSPDHRWFPDFAAFCALFAITAERGKAHRVRLPDGRPLLLGWATGDARFLNDLSA